MFIIIIIIINIERVGDGKLIIIIISISWISCRKMESNFCGAVSPRSLSFAASPDSTTSRV